MSHNAYPPPSPNQPRRQCTRLEWRPAPASDTAPAQKVNPACASPYREISARFGVWHADWPHPYLRLCQTWTHQYRRKNGGRWRKSQSPGLAHRHQSRARFGAIRPRKPGSYYCAPRGGSSQYGQSRHQLIRQNIHKPWSLLWRVGRLI